ncbi:TPA: ThiF family adenylyltransferase [Stenotrophomonas maltophilia]|uniref:ThiF family adenylyltransferase n=1 Tax=Stenotrophomonas TaxID=40323 RepID=UPI000C14D2FF|nr:MULTISPECIES: ThiF family adenylyltransferase [Stenotrophomonas]
MIRASASQVIEAFAPEGFVFAGKAQDGRFRLAGSLFSSVTPKGVPCEIDLDPEFFELPRIRLLQIPPHLPAAIPHISANGVLCYIAKGTVTLDIFDPIGQSLACLRKAQQVFEQVMKGEMVEDLAEEFYAYWGGGTCLTDLHGDASGRQEFFVVEGRDHPIWFVTDDLDRTKRKAEILGFKPDGKTTPIYLIKTTAHPRPVPGTWPPRTVGEILMWQSKLDRNCRRQIHRRILQGERDKARILLVLIQSPLMNYAFGVLYDRDKARPKAKLADRRDRTLGLQVIPFSTSRIDDRYVVERNIPGRTTLAGRKIALIGCGTIGGFLSEMLVKAGAGLLGGHLKLIDSDTLLPQNLGRHRLGFPSLLKNKAEAMAEELRRHVPDVSITAVGRDARDLELDDQDILIDATGEETFGHWLSHHYAKPLPVLSTWIEGPGIAVRTHLRAGQGACYRCLWENTRFGQLRSTAQPLPEVLAGQGCEGLYVPFGASASVQAASLAIDVMLDWAAGDVSPILRTRMLNRSFDLATPDGDFEVHPGCPSCT